MAVKIIKTNDFIEVVGHYDNDILCAKLTLLADLYAVEHIKGYAKFKVEDLDKLDFIDDKLDFKYRTIIIDGVQIEIGGFSCEITSTSLVSDDGADGDSGVVWTYSGSGTFLGFSTTQGATTPDNDLEVGDTFAMSSYYNVNLYSVSQQASSSVNDLTNTTWLINETPTISEIDDWNINFTSSGNTYTYFGLTLAYLMYGQPPTASIYYDSGEVYNDNDGWINASYRTITITGGTGATNSDLIAWLEANATQVTSANNYDLSYNLTNLTNGNVSLTFVADTGYALPSSITVSNGTLVSWNQSTGVAVISGYSNNTSVSVECVVARTAITCTVTGLGSSNPSDVVFTKDENFTKAGLGIEDTTINGNVFVKIPKLYRKVNTVSDGQITSFTIATAKVDNDYYPYPCFVDENGNELDYVLIGKYFNKNSSGINSVASGSNIYQTLATARQYAQALGTGYQLYDWMMMRMWQDLIICMMETVDTNNGSGLQTDALGISWQTLAFWVDGVIKGTTNKWWICDKPTSYVSLNSTSDGIPTNYVETDYSASTSSGVNITKLGYDSSKPFANFVAAASGSSYTQYYCDAYFYSSGSRPFSSLVGLTYADCGAFYSDGGYFVWSSLTCVRLCYRPIQ